MAWFTEWTADKQEFIARGTVAALLLVKKCGKVSPILLITPSADCPNAYKIQASNDLSLLSPAYISKLGTIKSICGIMDKALAVEFKIAFIDSEETLLDGTQRTCMTK